MSLPSNDFHGSDDELDTGFVFEHLRLDVALSLRRHDAGLVDHAATQRRIRSLHDLQFPCTCAPDDGCASRCAKAETSLNDRLRRIHHRGRIFPSTPRSKKGPNGLPVTVNETEPDRQS